MMIKIYLKNLYFSKLIFNWLYENNKCIIKARLCKIMSYGVKWLYFNAQNNQNLIIF